MTSGPPTPISVAARLLGHHVEQAVTDPASSAPVQRARRRSAPKPPEHLNDAARAEWRRVIKSLDVTTLDVAALAVYCQAYARWAEAERNIAQFGMVVRGENGPIASPYLKISLDASRQIERLVRIMGLGIAEQ